MQEGRDETRSGDDGVGEEQELIALIREVEAEAAQLVDEARREAEECLRAARSEARRLGEQIVSEARQEGKKAESEARGKSRERLHALKAQEVEAAESVRKAAEERLPTAVKRITRAFWGALQAESKPSREV